MFVVTKTRSQPPNVIRSRIVPNGLWVFLARQTPRSRHADVREQADVPFVMHIPISTLAIRIVMLDAMNKLGALEVLNVGFLLHQFSDRCASFFFKTAWAVGSSRRISSATKASSAASAWAQRTTKFPSGLMNGK
jgi:hypothetical protein